MYAGISPARPGYRNGFAGNGAQRFFQTFLNGYCVGLNLPTVKTSAFVGQFYKIPLCQWIDFLQK